MTGFVKYQRERFKHPLFRSQKFCRGYAWDWLVSQASYMDREIDVRGKTIILKRGQLSHSIRFIADIWNWDKAAVSRFLTRLKTETMIETSTETGQLIITICNYSEYQDSRNEGETDTDTPNETKVRQQRDKQEESKEGKEDIGPDKSDLFSANSKTEKAKKKVITKNSFPEWIKPDHAQGILDQRRGKKSPVTEFWFKKFIAKMEDVKSRGGDPNRAIEMIIDKNWQGFEPDWFFNGNQQNGQKAPTTGIRAQIAREREAKAQMRGRA